MFFKICFAVWIILFANANAIKAREKRQTTGGPVFSQTSYTFCVSNLNQGNTVGQVSLTSAGVGRSFFSLPSGSSNVAIDPTTGKLYFSNTVGQGTTLSLTVQATDMSGRSATSTVIVQTSNCPNSPGGSTQLAFPQSSYQFRLSNCQFGTFVGQVSVSTSPPGSTVTYSTIPTNANIQLFPNNGMIYLTGTITGSVTFNLIATSSFGQTKSVPVTITNSCASTVNLVFSQPSYTFTPPSCSAGAIIGRVAANSGTAYFGLEPTSSQFTIEGGTGNIKANSGVGPGTYSITVRLYDSTLLPTQTTAVVRITCSAASAAAFPQSSYQFGPVCGAGSIVGTVSLANPPFGTSYVITPPLSGVLYINPTNGQIILRNVVGISPINFSVRATYPGGSAVVPVSVTTCSNKPTFSQQQFSFFPSNCAAGTQIGQVSVVNPSSSIRYSLGLGGAGFAIDNVSGWIMSTVAMTSNRRNVLTVMAVDSSTGQSARTTVIVQSPTNCGIGSATLFPPGVDLG